MMRFLAILVAWSPTGTTRLFGSTKFFVLIKLGFNIRQSGELIPSFSAFIMLFFRLLNNP